MIALLIQVIVGLIGGVAAGLQAPFTGVMGQKIGDLGSVVITYVGGGVMIGVIALAVGGHNLQQWRTLPWYVFAAGPLGLVIIGALSYTVPRLGAIAAMTLFILSWLAFSAVIDHFGWFGVAERPLDVSRTVGIGALLLGTWLVIR